MNRRSLIGAIAASFLPTASPPSAPSPSGMRNQRVLAISRPNIFWHEVRCRITEIDEQNVYLDFPNGNHVLLTASCGSGELILIFDTHFSSSSPIPKEVREALREKMRQSLQKDGLSLRCGRAIGMSVNPNEVAEARNENAKLKARIAFLEKENDYRNAWAAEEMKRIQRAALEYKVANRSQ